MTEPDNFIPPPKPKVIKPPKGKSPKQKPWSGLKIFAEAQDGGIEEDPIETLYRGIVLAVGDVFESLFGEHEEEEGYRAAISREASRRLNQRRDGKNG